MINQYKRRDVFRCSQEAHREFDGRVSVWHVLREKECYPQGCLYFLWHCAMLAKGRACIKGYTWAGRNCKGCTHFIEEKVHLQPCLGISEQEYDSFLDELEGYEIWLDEIRYKRLAVAGEITAVKPWAERRLTHDGARLRLLGYLLILRHGFIGTRAFDDTFYIRVSRQMLKEEGFHAGMQIECTGEIRLDRGRIIVHRPKGIEIGSPPGGGDIWTDDQALVAVKTAVCLPVQYDTCHDCAWSVLVDAIDQRQNPHGRFRNLYCLKGIESPTGCPVRISEILRSANAAAPVKSAGRTAAESP
ncbi:hypothetical protein JXO52_05125 [bacterium]|nr:hypothetical protein [bacterium]